MLFRIAAPVGHGSIESWLPRLSEELSLMNFLKMMFCHGRGFSLRIFFRAGRPSDMILSHKSSFFTDCRFPTEAKKSIQRIQSNLSLPGSCELITNALLCVVQDVLLHKESVAVMGYNIVKETIWAKLVLLSGKLCYQTKAGVLVLLW